MFDCVKCGAGYSQTVEMCNHCGGFSCVLPRSFRPLNTLWRGNEAECQSASVLVRRSWAGFNSEAYSEIKMGLQSLFLIYGPPGAGKSTMMMKWLDGIDGPVIYLSIEEGLGDSLTKRLRWLEIKRDDFYVVGSVGIQDFDSLIGEKRPLAIGIDSLSVSTFQVSDLRRIALSYGVPVVFTLHVTKGGIPAGLNSILHESDLVVGVVAGEDGGEWSVEKSRFSGLVTGRV